MQASECLTSSIANCDKDIKELSDMIVLATSKGYTHIDLKDNYPGGVYAYFKSNGFKLHTTNPVNTNDTIVYRVSWGGF